MRVKATDVTDTLTLSSTSPRLLAGALRAAANYLEDNSTLHGRLGCLGLLSPEQEAEAERILAEERINRAVERAVRDYPELRERLTGKGGGVTLHVPEGFTVEQARELVKALQPWLSGEPTRTAQ